MQSHISTSLAGLDFKTKYGLTDYADSLKPLVIFGMYTDRDFNIFKKHASDIIVVWQGHDAKKLSDSQIQLLKSKEAVHYSISHWITDALNEVVIESTYCPISATSGKAEPFPRGTNVYFYTSKMSLDSANIYGHYMIDEIRERTGLNFIIADYQTYNKEELKEVYKSCFVNLRLTKFDGCPNTNLEMGLLGRRSIFNGNVPGAIKWNGVEDICKSIMREYYKRDEDNTELAELTEIFINSPNKLFK